MVKKFRSPEFTLFSGMYKRSIPASPPKPVEPDFGSFNNPKPAYDKEKHMARFMVGIELLRAGKSPKAC